MKMIPLLVICIAAAMLQSQAFAQDGCPGMCAQCRTDALSVCGAGCVQSVTCSNKDCSCSYVCRGGCHPSTAGISLDENFSLFRPAQFHESDNQYLSSPTVQIKVVEQPTVPVALAMMSVHNEPGRGLSELTINIKNQAGSTLRQASVMVVFISPLNEPLGGESFCERVSLKSGADRTLHIPLRHYVETGQRLWLAVKNFKTDDDSWADEGQGIVKNIKQHDPAFAAYSE